MNLSDELLKKKKELKKRTPGIIQKYMDYFTQSIKAGGYEQKPLKVGDSLPNHQLIDSTGASVLLYDLIDNHPTIIKFYRGSWCPYCNLELSAYQHVLSQKENDMVKLIAISPEQPDVTDKAMDVSKLPFKVLSDKNNQYASKLGLVFKTSWFLRFIYRFDGINLHRSQNNKDGQLPIPVTYIIDKTHTITHAWIDADYTKRPNPEAVIKDYWFVAKKK